MPRRQTNNDVAGAYSASREHRRRGICKGQLHLGVCVVRESDESGLVCRVRLRVCDLVQGKTMDNVPVLVVDSLVDVVFFVDILLNFHLTFVGSATPPCRSPVTAVRCDRGIVVVSRQCRAGVTVWMSRHRCHGGVTVCHGGGCHGAGVKEVSRCVTEAGVTAPVSRRCHGVSRCGCHGVAVMEMSRCVTVWLSRHRCHGGVTVCHGGGCHAPVSRRCRGVSRRRVSRAGVMEVSRCVTEAGVTRRCHGGVTVCHGVAVTAPVSWRCHGVSRRRV